MHEDLLLACHVSGFLSPGIRPRGDNWPRDRKPPHRWEFSRHLGYRPTCQTIILRIFRSIHYRRAIDSGSVTVLVSDTLLIPNLVFKNEKHFHFYFEHFAWHCILLRGLRGTKEPAHRHVKRSLCPLCLVASCLVTSFDYRDWRKNAKGPSDFSDTIHSPCSKNTLLLFRSFLPPKKKKEKKEKKRKEQKFREEKKTECCPVDKRGQLPMLVCNYCLKRQTALKEGSRRRILEIVTSENAYKRTTFSVAVMFPCKTNGNRWTRDSISTGHGRVIYSFIFRGGAAREMKTSRVEIWNKCRVFVLSHAVRARSISALEKKKSSEGSMLCAIVSFQRICSIGTFLPPGGSEKINWIKDRFLCKLR